MKIEVNQVSKSFQKHQVLGDITLTIDSGQIVCLLGASGSGKTTLLRIIMGAIPADKGGVNIDGKSMPDRKLLQAIGFMPQNDALYEELSAWDNLKFFAGLQKVKRAEFLKNAEQILSIVGLSNEKNKLIRNYSGGMKKRISLAVALIHQPDILLLDEPTVGIDPVLRKQIWNYLKKLKEQGKTIVVTTHVMDEVMECDNAALLRNGHIIASDTIDHLIDSTPNGKIEELFFMDEKTGEESLC
ncbi:ATP-binding cassette domain-containing protein [Anaerocolumna sedimenticola]|uniref:ATP-binding cassette domain-containing protein n=1 Tax=Anaerocolumna sedimenticola TaxID=2696063 RepID=A0A6P1TQI9_9FIRM|nr:ABC transporter ATP-binding protein [Anaerocolumna sedimenticola]QHQ63530.1 ATP-binding cassette domain-containing protein [Anaerocolumna sedimenticola]